MEQLLTLHPHRLRGHEFDRLAGARPAPDLIGALTGSRLSRSLLLLAHILRESPGVEPAATMLTHAHEADSRAVNALLVSPWTAVWILACVREPDLSGHRRMIDALALAAAAKAGLVNHGIHLTPVDQQIIIPTLGSLTRQRPGWVSTGDLQGPGWRPITTLVAAHHDDRITVQLDDLDPYRDCHRAAVSARLDADQTARFAARFQEAWQLLVEYSPERAAELTAGLRSVTLLAEDGSAGSRSATCADAFGGLATTMPEDGAQLAGVLVHEFHHSKLAALNSLAPLTEPDQPAIHFAPWRPDLRPLPALLHGIYAFTAVATLWWDLAKDPALQESALRAFAHRRSQVRRALSGLDREDPGLTSAGRRLVAALAASAAEMNRLPVPEQIEADALASSFDAEARVRPAPA